MPRDSTATKERLLREAERLFARRGLYQVTIREITEAAEQRNVSALNYHFGSREGLLDAILARHGDRTDLARGEMLHLAGRDATSRELVAALVVPYAANLSRPDGRDYLNSDSTDCGAWFAIDRAWTPNCCLVCRAWSLALSLARSASTRFPTPAVMLS